jgi:hypothetical protein
MNLLCISKIDQIRPQSVRSTTNRDRLVPIPWICTPKPKSPYTLAPEERIEVGNGGAHLANRLASAASFVVGRLELRHALRRRRPGVPPRGGRNPERTRLELRHALRRRRPGVPPRVEAQVPNALAWSSATRFVVAGLESRRAWRSPERTRLELRHAPACSSLLGRRLEASALPRGRASAILHFLSPRIHFARPVCTLDWRRCLTLQCTRPRHFAFAWQVAAPVGVSLI